VSAALASLLVVTIGWLVAERWAGPASIDSRPSAQAVQPPPVSSYQPPASGRQAEPRRIVDWSQPTEDFQPPPEPPEDQAGSVKRETMVFGAPAPPADAVKKSGSVRAAPETAGKAESAAAKRVVPPPARIRPEADTPERFVQDGTVWIKADGPPVTSDEAVLDDLGTAVKGHSLYGLSGEDEHSALFLETSPGSGRYRIYRPVG
jgi:hypothetical protein